MVLVPLALWHFRKTKPPEAVQVLIAAAAIFYLITMLYYFRTFYLANRHTLTVQLLLLLVVPFYCRDLFTQRFQWKQAVALLAVVTVGAHIYLQLRMDSGGRHLLYRGYEYQYKVDAGQWLKRNVGREQRLFTNDVHLYIEGGGIVHPNSVAIDRAHKISEVAAEIKPQDYDVFALSIKKKRWKTPLIQALSERFGAPLETFVGLRGDRVVIYGPGYSHISV